jgi:hypothetical protein
MSFEITGPGRYRRRNGDLVDVRPMFKPDGHWKWISEGGQIGKLACGDNGQITFEHLSKYDIVARVDEPQPDVQDGIMGVEDAPPIGLMPRWLHEENRAKALSKAIHRYTQSGKEIPAEWEVELLQLTRRPTPSALERLEAWRGGTDRKLWRIDIRDGRGDCECRIYRSSEPGSVSNALEIWGEGPTIADAINAALDLAEGVKR